MAVLSRPPPRYVRRHGETVTTMVKMPALNYIGGEWVESTSHERVRDVNPARSSESLGDATVSRPEDVVRAIDAAAAAYQEWRRTPAPQRGDFVRKAADLMEQRRLALARLLTQEEGKTLSESLAEVDRAIANVRFAAAQGARLNGETIPSTQRGTFIYTVRDPLGVVACITPWNFPVAIPAWKIAPALVAGNAVVFKPATLTPLCAAQVVQCFIDGGVPEGVLNMVLASKADTWRAGDGLADGVRLGPIVDDTQLRKVRERIEAGKREGARVVRDGSAPSKPDLKAGYFVEPTIFADVDPNMSVAQEEIFGPVVSIIPANDFESALAVANSVGYGLSTSIYTRDLSTAFRYAEESEAGMLHVNIPTVGGEAQVPFGGVKDSGFGDRECGTAAFDFFTEQRVVYVGY